MLRLSILCFFVIVHDVSSSAIGRIAFLSGRDGDYEIYAINTDGSSLQRLTNHPSGIESIRISPDRRQIAFNANQDGITDIFVLDVDGGDLTQITHGFLGRHNLYPIWLPNSLGLLYEKVGAHEGDEPPCRRCYFDLELGIEFDIDQTKWTYPGSDGVWSPDGTHVAYTHNGELHVGTADGSIDMIIGAGLHPSWSPDGKKIAFYSSSENRTDLFIVNRDGSGLIQLTDTPEVDEYTPSWSPNGREIAFTAVPIGSDPNIDIFVININGTDTTRITKDPAYDLYPLWLSIDSSTIVKPSSWGNIKNRTRN